jgi:carboxylesterase type B
LNNRTAVNNFMKNSFPQLTDDQLATAAILYPGPETTQYPGKGSFWRPAADLYGQMRYNCPGLYMSGAYPQAGVNASWNYRWDVLRPENIANGLGVTHVAEGGAIWGTTRESDPEHALQPIIQSYWTSFIRSHDPNTFRLKTAPEWVGYHEGDDAKGGHQRMHFGNDASRVGIETVATFIQEKCKFWSSIGAKIGQ